jgi:hypothetical protein
MSTTLQPDLSIMNATDTLEIRDSRTGKSYSVPITDGTIRAQDLRQIRVDDSEFGMMSYDPAFMNTAACRSATALGTPAPAGIRNASRVGSATPGAIVAR